MLLIAGCGPSKCILHDGGGLSGPMSRGDQYSNYVRRASEHLEAPPELSSGGSRISLIGRGRNSVMPRKWTRVIQSRGVEVN